MIVVDVCLWKGVISRLSHQKPLDMTSCRLIFCIRCYMFLFLGRQTPPLTVEKSRTTPQPLNGAMGSGFCLFVMSALGPAPSSFSPAQSEPLVLASGSALLLMSSGSDSLKTLLLMFNGYIFYLLSNGIAQICDYPEGKERIALYIDVIKQVEKIFDLRSAFVEGLIKAIKKDKS